MEIKYTISEQTAYSTLVLIRLLLNLLHFSHTHHTIIRCPGIIVLRYYLYTAGYSLHLSRTLNLIIRLLIK